MILFCGCRDEKEKESEGDTQETDAFSKYNNWTKDTYNSYLARFVMPSFSFHYALIFLALVCKNVSQDDPRSGSKLSELYLISFARNGREHFV